MLLAQVVDGQGNIAGKIIYEVGQSIVTLQETDDLIAAKTARSRFRRLFVTKLFQLKWNQLNLHWGDRSYRIAPLHQGVVAKEKLIQAYQASWANAEIYQKVFTAEEAEEILDCLKSGFIALRQNGDVCGLVAGWPVAQTPEEEFASLVRSPQHATYLAEWSLTDSSTSSADRGIGLGSFLLALYLRSLLVAGQQEVVLVTAEKGYGTAQWNAARPLYEAHGFRPCKDATGGLLSTSIRQLRLDGKMGTHASIFYHATAESIRAALTPENVPIDGFQFELAGHFNQLKTEEETS